MFRTLFRRLAVVVFWLWSVTLTAVTMLWVTWIGLIDNDGKAWNDPTIWHVIVFLVFVGLFWSPTVAAYYKLYPPEPPKYGPGY